MNAVNDTAASNGLAAGTLRWYCLRARPKRESFAARQLRDRTGLEVFAPRLQIEVRRRRAAVSSEPLFPGYLFARFDLSLDARFVSSSPDILGLVQFGRHVPPVGDDVIHFLRAQTADRHILEPLFAVGDWVEVLTGAFMGQTGRVVAFDQARERASLLLSLLGGEVRVQIPVDSLRSPGRDLHFPPALLASSA